jgi:outer membrane murein-binding lipoprotein Lpp
MVTWLIFAAILAAAILIGCATHALTHPKRKDR